MDKHYLYRHIRLDTNQVFYIGIGTKGTNDNKYSYYTRAHVRSQRSLFWKRIVEKTDYKIEILFESDNYDFILEKEKEFIKLYGRRDLGLGTLVNMTDGGIGQKGAKKVVSDSYRIKMKEWHKNHPEFKSMLGKKHREDTKEQIKISQQKKVLQKNPDGSLVKEWESINEAHKAGFDKNGIARSHSGKSGKKGYKRRNNLYKGFIWEIQTKNCFLK